MSGLTEAAPTPVASHAGLRETPRAPLSAERVALTVGGFAALLRHRGLPESLALARDRRPRSEELAEVAADAALASGLDVWDLGAVSTPAAKLAARERELGGTVVVTGSHLGPELTGLKLSVAPVYAPVDVRTLPEAGPERGGGQRREVTGAAEEHARAVAAAVDVAAVRSTGVAAEIVGGGEAEGEALTAELGLLPGGMRLELDADGDRMSAGDSEWTLPLAAIARAPRLVVRGADTSRMVDRVAPAVTTVPPGELHLVEALVADGRRPALAGEGNGGLVVPEIVLARDGLASAALLIELVAISGIALDEHVARLPGLARRRSELPLGSVAEVSRLVGASGDEAVAGVAVERGGGLWGLVRQSATEPILRVTVEGPDEEAVETLHEELLAALAG